MKFEHWTIYIGITLNHHGCVLVHFTPREYVVFQLFIYECIDFGFLKDFEDGVCDFKLTHE
jgi:hypothetical protein